MKKAFTLIELLVVVLIIGILSAIALPQYTRTVEKARCAEAMQNASALQKALDMYVLESGYPAAGASNQVVFTKATNAGLLNIDITQGLSCDVAGYCWNQYFVYYSSCSSISCYFTIDRLPFSTSDQIDWSYRLEFHRAANSNEWTKECTSEEDKQYICKGLEHLGFTRDVC